MRPSLFIFTILILSTFGYSYNKITYMDPLPGANYVSTANNIVLGFNNQITLSETQIRNDIRVTDSKGMQYDGTIILCGNGTKIIFKPLTPFSLNEKITVKITGKLLSRIYSNRKKYEYSFNTSGLRPVAERIAKSNSVGFKNFNDNPPPLDPPQLTVTVNTNPADGFLFLAPFTTASYLVITDKNGSLFWYSIPSWWTADFKKQPNGNYTYWDGNVYKHFEMDQNYNTIDTFACGNGYLADIHELRVLNNHAFLMAYDTQIVDMSQIVQGGDSTAHVIGLIIQELDESKNVVFQWRSWDHFQITDATHENLLAPVIDYVHGNAIEVDDDNSIMISSRHLDEITKIDLTTGDIIWRWGGRHNQFTFANDTIGFSHQHSIRRIANGNLTMFDNGNFHTPPFSRAVEYHLDEINKTATLVWQYRHTPSVFGAFMGYVQRLDNGNTLISWGGTTPTITEVTSNGTVVFEASYPPGQFTYRAYKFPMGNPVVINDGNMEHPTSYSLKQNYPNPFNPSTLIKYDIPRGSYVELTVFDITGREVKKLVSEYKQPGSYSVSFDGSRYASGLYFYRLKAGDFTATQKMILVK